MPRKLVVIDDGSVDGSPKIIEEVLSRCPFDCEFIVRENRGLSVTLNQALELSDGDYFAYLGSDDLWLPDFLENRVRLLRDNSLAVLAFGHSYLIDEDNRIVDCTKDWLEYSKGQFLHNLLEGIVPVTSGVVFRRSILKDIGWNVDAELEDYELYLKLSQIGNVAFDPNVLSAWRQHSYNTSADYGKMLNEWLEAQNRVAQSIGIGKERLVLIQRRLRFVSAINFIRRGNKSEAWKMIWSNWKAARSISEVINIALRMALPKSFNEVLRERRRQNQIRRYGRLNI